MNASGFLFRPGSTLRAPSSSTRLTRSAPGVDQNPSMRPPGESSRSYLSRCQFFETFFDTDCTAFVFLTRIFFPGRCIFERKQIHLDHLMSPAPLRCFIGKFYTGLKCSARDEHFFPSLYLAKILELTVFARLRSVS